jgi:hypothetical protein
MEGVSLVFRVRSSGDVLFYRLEGKKFRLRRQGE